MLKISNLSQSIFTLLATPFVAQIGFAQPVEIRSTDIYTFVTAYEDALEFGCRPSQQAHENTARPLSPGQLELLNSLYTITSATNYPPRWEHLSVEGSHYWNIHGLQKYLMPQQEGIVFLYKVPFGTSPILSTAEWFWDSDSQKLEPETEIWIQWCRKSPDGLGYRHSGSVTYMTRDSGEWKLFPP